MNTPIKTSITPVNAVTATVFACIACTATLSIFFPFKKNFPPVVEPPRAGCLVIGGRMMCKLVPRFVRLTSYLVLLSNSSHIGQLHRCFTPDKSTIHIDDSRQPIYTAGKERGPRGTRTHSKT